VRPTVQAAIDGVETCSRSPSSGQATLQQAISTRQHILSGLAGLSPAGLPHGAQLIARLQRGPQTGQLRGGQAAYRPARPLEASVGLPPARHRH
jgi:hypothetical protein